MAILADRRDSPARVATAYAVELMWAFAAASDDERIESTPIYKTIYADATFRARAQLVFDDPSPCRDELVVLANVGGVLESSDPATTLAGITRALTEPQGPMRLATETADDRTRIHQRLGSLIEDVELRERYLLVIEDLSAALEKAWDTEGRSSAGAEAERLRVELDRGLTWQHILERNCPKCGTFVDRLGADFTPEQLLVVPSAYARPTSALLLDLPGCLVLGVSARRDNARDHKARDELAKRLKAVADPTRLALLVRLSDDEGATVGSLAHGLGVSQPTVSNHLKILRAAGLVSGGDRSGSGGSLVVESTQLDELLRELRSTIFKAAPPAVRSPSGATESAN